MTDAAFGNWLAGFIDGEGCFVIQRRSNRPSHCCWFELTVRVDDAAVITEIQRRLGIGRVYPLKARGGNEAPQLRWQVMTKRDCLDLVELLGRYVLRAKKREDFAIWTLAVKEWCGEKDQELMARYKRALEDGRRYGYEAATLPPPPPPQLRLVN